VTRGDVIESQLGNGFGCGVVLVNLQVGCLGSVFFKLGSRHAQREHQFLAVGRDIEIADIAVAAGDAAGDIDLGAAGARLARTYKSPPEIEVIRSRASSLVGTGF